MGSSVCFSNGPMLIHRDTEIETDMKGMKLKLWLMLVTVTVNSGKAIHGKTSTSTKMITDMKTMPTPTTMTPIAATTTRTTGTTTTATAAAAVSKTAIDEEISYGFHPDRDNTNIFSMRVPRKAVPAIEPDSISVKVENDEGYICAEEAEIHDLEINGLPCDHCVNSELLITIETKKENEIMSKTQTILSDESKRAAICNLQPEKRKQGEDLIMKSPKQKSEDGCRWVFRDAGGSIGCCYSNRDYYTETGGCDPRMQSSACRKGSESPILVEEENSCTLRINNLRPADSGNYLSKFLFETPGFKKIILVEGGCEGSVSYVMIALSFAIVFGILTSLYLYVQRTSVLKLIKENLKKINNSKRTNIQSSKFEKFVGQQEIGEGLIV